MLSASSGLTAALDQRRQEQRLRTLRNVAPIGGVEIQVAGKCLLNFSSNDYLGLSQHPFLKERAIEFISAYGVGAGASRLVSGNHEIYENIENRLATLKGTESALLFSTGYQLNLTVLLALAKLDGYFFCDKLCHNSLILGATLHNHSFIRFKHNDLADLEQKLSNSKSTNTNCTNWIVSESVFGMDGDQCNLVELNNLAQKLQSKIFIDEAHATGVFGKNGMGLATNLDKDSIVMGTFSKGLGTFGAYIACSKEWRDYLINFCPGFIYTTGLPPPVLAAIQAALEIVPTMSKEREHLQALANYLRNEIKSLGLDTGASTSQIIPIIVHSEENALSLAQYLENAGIFVTAIRPPTVSTGTARVRISLTALHNENHIEQLLSALKNWQNRQTQ